MPGAAMTPQHLDEFTLLRLVTSDLDDLESAATRRHLRECAVCREGLEGIEALDKALRRVRECLSTPDRDAGRLPVGDPFRFRPAGSAGRRRPAAAPGADLASLALAATRLAAPLKEELLGASAGMRPALLASLDSLRLDELPPRYALGYALDEAIGRMVEAPARWLALGEASVARVERQRRSGARPAAAVEAAYPLLDLAGLGNLVAGTARNWTGDLARGAVDLARAFRAFAAGSRSEARLAQAELAESQRRSFADRPEEGLVLARRATASFDALDQVENLARARGAQALALSYLGREEEALAEYRASRDAFQGAGLWNGWVTALHGVGTCLLKLGRLDEARREYARALKLVSRDERPAVHAFVRSNLARTLFGAGRYAESARAFADAAALFERLDAPADSLACVLGEIESLARAGSWLRADALFARFKTEVEEKNALDPPLLSSLGAILSGETRDLDLLEVLRERAEEGLRRLRRATA